VDGGIPPGFLSRRGIEAARTAWAVGRAGVYLAVFLWWTRREDPHPWFDLLSGVFLADIASWMLFTIVELPFRGVGFATEFVAYSALGAFVWHGATDLGPPMQRGGIAFAALGFGVTFAVKATRWFWTKLVQDA
jgi:hypothetical protein